MNYIEEIKIELAKHIEVEADLLDLYALLVLTKGLDTTAVDVHDAWSIWKNKTNSSHKSLIPFHELTEEVQRLDDEYMFAIRATASMLAG